MKHINNNLITHVDNFLNSLTSKIDNFIIEKYIKIILLTTLVFLFSIFCTLKIWNAKIITTNETVEVVLPYNKNIIQPSNVIIGEDDTLQLTLETKNELEQPIKKIKPNIRKSNKQTKFIIEISKPAISESKSYGIPASIKIGQAALESGWGEDPIAVKYNNHYGMKYKKTFSKDEKTLVMGRINRKTKEFIKGEIETTRDDFVVYKTRWNSIRHHSEFLRGRIDSKYNSGYTSMGKLSKKDYKGWAKALQKAGYSTNPNYAKELIRIIEDYKLYKYDK